MKRRRYTPAEVAMFGTAPDPVIAAKLGTSAKNIQEARSIRGIPPFTPPGGKSGVRIDWRKWRRLAGKIPNTKLAEMIGCSDVAVLKYLRRNQQP